MTARETVLKPALDVATASTIRFPNESAEYRRARTALLAEEIELRRHLERVAAQRRALPPGGEVREDYVFEGAHGPVRLSELFGDKNTLVTYNFMFGPQRERPCPMCTCLLGALDANTPDIRQRVAFAVFARAPIERLTAWAKERGWRYLPLYSSGGNTFNADYAHEPPGQDIPAMNVFTRRARTDAAVEPARSHAGRACPRLVSEALVLKPVTPRKPKPHAAATLPHKESSSWFSRIFSLKVAAKRRSSSTARRSVPRPLC